MTERTGEPVLPPDGGERVQCAVCHRWPLASNWPNHMQSQGDHWPIWPPVTPTQPVPSGLDVRRVVQAITNIALRHGLSKDPPLVQPTLMSVYGYSRATPDMDAEIAAEYALLATATPPADEARCQSCRHLVAHHLDSAGCYCGCALRGSNQ